MAEEKDNKKTLIALIILILLLLAALAYFLFFFKMPAKKPAPAPEVKQEQPAEKPQTTEEEVIATSVKQMVINVDDNAPAADKGDIEKANLEKVASLFAERLGSYSNQSEYGNILDLKILMTESMRTWADGYIAKAKADAKYDGVYRGTVTRAISSNVSDFNSTAGTAKAVVSTQRVDSTGENNNESVYYEDLALTFKKEGSTWLVDDARWQGKKSN
jgi:hypothetical protein